MVKALVYGQPVDFEVDFGAAGTLLIENVFEARWSKQPPALNNADIQLCTWSGASLSVLGLATMTVRCQDSVCDLPLLVVQGDRASLLGRKWFAQLGIGVADIHRTSMGPAVHQRLLDKFCSVFNADLIGCLAFLPT